MESTATTSNDVVLFAQNLLRAGFAHGFSTRPLNFGERAPSAASAAEREADVLALADAVGFDAEALRQVKQVHGAHVVRATQAQPDAASRVEADALVTPAEDMDALAIGVRVADCVPVLVGDRRIGAVAAIHAGWRGVVSGVIANAMRELAAIGSGDFVAAIGPCIGACCFEVKSDVAAQIAAAAGDPGVVVRATGDHALVDLRRAVRAQLTAAHVHDLEDVAGCTKCDAARFFSYRRDGEASGRHLAVIVARNRAPVSSRLKVARPSTPP
jgi:YfiH family protein